MKSYDQFGYVEITKQTVLMTYSRIVLFFFNIQSMSTSRQVCVDREHQN